MLDLRDLLFVYTYINYKLSTKCSLHSSNHRKINIMKLNSKMAQLLEITQQAQCSKYVPIVRNFESYLEKSLYDFLVSLIEVCTIIILDNLCSYSYQPNYRVAQPRFFQETVTSMMDMSFVFAPDMMATMGMMTRGMDMQVRICHHEMCCFLYKER